VIGAGISGLTAGKMLKDYGVAYTTFETSDRIGGNWAFGNPNGHSSAYRSLHIDTSRKTLSFRDFPMPDHYPSFPHHSDIKAYLDAYSDAFGLLDSIEFGNGVVHAGRRDGGGWNIEDQAGNHREFDLLVVANGHRWDPRLPDFPGAFTGEAIHSHHYIDPLTPLELTDKRILVVGIGNCAADITVELSSKTLQNKVTISTRSSAWIVPKYIAGIPGDTFFHTSPYLPLSWQRKAIQMLAPVMGINPQLYGLPAPNHKLFEAHPRSRWSCRCGWAPAT
jgi:cation diffusion facilitator CzcD-associated flavoprotein CzcO